MNVPLEVAAPVATALLGAIGAMWGRLQAAETRRLREVQLRDEEQEREIKSLREQTIELRAQLATQQIRFLQRQLDTLTVSRGDTRAAIDMVTEMKK